MASKFLTLDEAAKALGVTTDELNEMRLRQEIYGYRDGASWKFKSDDVEKAQNDRAAGGSSGIGGGSAADLLAALGSPGDSLLGGELLAAPSGGGSSTVIGQASKKEPAGDSGLALADEELIVGSDTGSGPLVAGDLGSGLLLGGDAGSALKLGEGSAPLLAAEPSSDLGLGSDTGKPAADQGSGLGLGSDIILVSPDEQASTSDVVLAPPDDDVLSSPSEVPLGLSESATVVKSGSELALGGSALLGGPGLDLTGAPSGGSSLLGGDSLLVDEPSPGDSSLHLADDDVLAGGSGSDITHRPSDSGILLIDPSDSGLSLDKPIDLSGSDAMLETTDFSAAAAAAAKSGTELKADDDFLLTPLDEAAEDESDSGSQVIMLDTEGDFDDATATLLASQVPGLNTSLLVEEESPLGGLGALGGEAPVSRAAAAPGTVMVPAQPEVQFSALSVAGLALCSIALAVCGIMIFDVVRNMWSWDSPYAIDSVILKNLIK